MREHLGDGFPLMVDANMKWTADQGVKMARALAEFDLVWLEEPTIPDDVAGHARVLRDGGLPVATGENLHTLYEFQHMVTAGAVTFPEPDVCNVGGMTVFRKVAALAEAHNLPVTSHGAHDLTVHLMAAAPNRSFMEVHGFASSGIWPSRCRSSTATRSPRTGPVMGSPSTSTRSKRIG
jgi:L-alanine-DL-glutamate epimerase-like enolase superfamily enzyme